MIGLQPELVNIRAFGTDGEVPLASAFKHEFRNAIHLQCLIHLRRNVKKKLQDYSGLSSIDIGKTLDEIFGNQIGSVYYEGLADAESAECFDEKLAELKVTWNERSSSFYEWFVKEKASIFKASVIRPVREAAGLGSPPIQFTTNVSETVNFILKSKVDYKKNELPQFVEKMRSLVCEQQDELQRAVYGRGKWKFRSAFRYLELSEAEWFSMLPVERKQYISTRVQNTFLEDGQATGDVIDVEPATVVPSTSADFTSEIRSGLSIDVKSFCHGIDIPFQSLQGIWSKAEELLSSSDNLTPAPGHGAAARMVRSTTGTRPHLVKPGKGGRFLCDSECLHYKSLGICSHVLR